jgi:hypothetical protein
MFDLGPMDVEFDAPPYSVVKACKGLGASLRQPRVGRSLVPSKSGNGGHL